MKNITINALVFLLSISLAHNTLAGGSTPAGVTLAPAYECDLLYGPHSADWNTEKSAQLYGLPAWGAPYLSIDRQSGNLQVTPDPDSPYAPVDVPQVLASLQTINPGRGPVLFRFPQIAAHRTRLLNEAFRTAIEQERYSGAYQCAYPSKSAHDSELIDAILAAGKPYNQGMESGTKPELILALSKVRDPNAVIVVNGYKDQDYVELALLAQRAGYGTIIVIENPDEVALIIHTAKKLGIPSPRIGLRAKLSSTGSGIWVGSGGEGAKFGLTMADLIGAVDQLKQVDMLGELKMLHTHLGSQLTDRRKFVGAAQEAAAIYADLVALGAPLSHLDFGGGLAVRYDASHEGEFNPNYEVKDYATTLVRTVKKALLSRGISQMPTLVSESGRALSSDYAFLVVNVFGAEMAPAGLTPRAEDSPWAKRAFELSQEIPSPSLVKKIEQLRKQILSTFRMGKISLVDRARAEQILNQTEGRFAPKTTYYGNFSLFSSMPDTWAGIQPFSGMPIGRLNEKPTVTASLADTSCDSDGRITCSVMNGKWTDGLALHPLQPGQSYSFGFFQLGTYQMELGNKHNLLGNPLIVSVTAGPNGHQTRVQAPVQTSRETLCALGYPGLPGLGSSAAQEALHRRCLELLDDSPYLSTP